MLQILVCRYGNQLTAQELTNVYGGSRASGLGAEVCLS